MTLTKHTRFRITLHLRGGTVVKFLASKFDVVTKNSQVTEAEWTNVGNGREILQTVNVSDISAVTYKTYVWWWLW